MCDDALSPLATAGAIYEGTSTRGFWEQLDFDSKAETRQTSISPTPLPNGALKGELTTAVMQVVVDAPRGVMARFASTPIDIIR